MFHALGVPPSPILGKELKEMVGIFWNGVRRYYCDVHGKEVAELARILCDDSIEITPLLCDERIPQDVLNRKCMGCAMSKN
jgi:hypothetical protein